MLHCLQRAEVSRAQAAITAAEGQHCAFGAVHCEGGLRALESFYDAQRAIERHDPFAPPSDPAQPLPQESAAFAKWEARARAAALKK